MTYLVLIDILLYCVTSIYFVLYSIVSVIFSSGGYAATQHHQLQAVAPPKPVGRASASSGLNPSCGDCGQSDGHTPVSHTFSGVFLC